MILKNVLLFLSSFLLCNYCFSQNDSSITLKNLTCDQIQNPCGLEDRHPAFGWQIVSQQRNVIQTSYHVLVASSLEKLSRGEADLWDSGIVFSDSSQWVSYKGHLPDSRAICYWKVKVSTSKGQSDWSEPARWEMGLLHFKDWYARWIGFNQLFKGETGGLHSKLAARYLRREFMVNKKIVKARLYLIGLGLNEVYFNGNPVEKESFLPSPTDYTKIVNYQVIDVISFLKQGKNVAGIVLGNGRFYTMRQYKPYKIRNFGFPKLLFQLELTYADGSQERICSDKHWLGTPYGPICGNNEYDGEIYDARKEMEGWAKSAFEAKDWMKVPYTQEPGGEYVAQLNPGMSVLKRISVKSVQVRDPGIYQLDLGQNFAGWLSVKVHGNRGDTIRLSYSETLKPDGTLDKENLRDAEQLDYYILRGDSVEFWHPHFVYHGFRYVEIKGLSYQPIASDFKGELVADDLEMAGTIATSDTTVNKIIHNAWWGILSNYKGMPVDCPQRNERQPWLGDRATGCYGEAFLFNNYPLYHKWIADIAGSQKKDGCISDVAPAFWNYYSDNMTWPGTFLMVGDMLFLQYGDKKTLKKYYPAMKKWFLYMISRYLNTQGVLTKDSYGDWCVPPLTMAEAIGQKANQKHPSKLIATSYAYYEAGLLNKFSEEFGFCEDTLFYQNLRQKIKNHFLNNFYHSSYFGFGDHSLTDNILPLAFGLVPDSLHDTICKTIKMNLVENQMHLSTGMIGTQWLLRTLTDNGMGEEAAGIVRQTTYPSWGYMVKQGATTVWELWNGNVANPKMNSCNHVMMLGDLLIWLYEDLAGIAPDVKRSGFKHLIIEPCWPIDQFHETNASLNTIYGLIESHWKVDRHQRLEWQLTIPTNTTATVNLPSYFNKVRIDWGASQPEKESDGNYSFVLGSGIYHIVAKLNSLQQEN